MCHCERLEPAVRNGPLGLLRGAMVQLIKAASHMRNSNDVSSMNTQDRIE